MDKKGMSWFQDWAEILAFILLIIGFLLSLSTRSKVISYFVVALCGLVFGRVWYRFKHGFKFPWFLLIIGFLIGYLIGNIYGDALTIIMLFLFGIVLSYQLHDKKTIRSVEH